MNCRAYAKGLHYKEEEFHREVTPKLLESLIAINNKLQQPDAAGGVLQYAIASSRGNFVCSLITNTNTVYPHTGTGIESPRGVV